MTTRAITLSVPDRETYHGTYERCTVEHNPYEVRVTFDVYSSSRGSERVVWVLAPHVFEDLRYLFDCQPRGRTATVAPLSNPRKQVVR